MAQNRLIWLFLPQTHRVRTLSSHPPIYAGALVITPTLLYDASAKHYGQLQATVSSHSHTQVIISYWLDTVNRRINEASLNWVLWSSLISKVSFNMQEKVTNLLITLHTYLPHLTSDPCEGQVCISSSDDQVW